MKDCNHENFDEYFGKCSDCNTSRKQVIAEQFVVELQPIYTKMLESLGIETGDIAPEQAIELEVKELELAEVVANWLDNRYESGE